MGYNGGKRVWPQRNSGFSKSSMRFGYKVLRQVSLPVLKIGFSALGLSNSGTKTNRRSPVNSTINKNFIQNSTFNTLYPSVKLNPFFSVSNLLTLSNSEFEPEIKKLKKNINQNKISRQNIDKLRKDINLKYQRIKSIHWLKLFYKKEIISLENEILRNEEGIKVLTNHLVDEYLDLSAYKKSELFEKLFDLILNSDLDSSSWMLYPDSTVPFQLYSNILNYGELFQRDSIKIQRESIQHIDNVAEKYICFKDSIILIVFLSRAIIFYSSELNFAIMNYADIKIAIKEVLVKDDYKYVSEKSVIDSMTWKFQKMDGTPNLRYKNNPQVPIVKYLNISLQSDNGIRIELLFSNLKFGMLFFEMFSKMKIE